MYYVLLLTPWFATFAMTVQLGLWSNTILLAQIVLAGLVAFGFYQPLAVLMDEQSGGTFTYLMDFLAIWALFTLTMLILKILDGLLSKKRMKFQPQVDQFGGAAVGFVAGWVMTGIVMASLHAAPLPPETLGADKSNFGSKSSLTSPDYGWLRLVESVSAAGALGSGESEFSVKEYVTLYATRAEAFAEEPNTRVTRSSIR